jgi:hypothetical protein
MKTIQIKVTAETARALLEATETIDGVVAFRASLRDALRKNLEVGDEDIEVTIQ